MKITLNKLTFKNVMTVGNIEQTIHLNDNLLILIVGRNKDINVEGSTNGVGKSTILQALTYAIYGEPLFDDIRKDKLVNLTNKKNMEISLEFSKDGIDYRIERGRKPTYNRLYISNEEYDETKEDHTRGVSRSTQEEITHIFGMSFELYKYIVTLDTFNRPFLSLKDREQRPLIEELLGITLLSKKAETIKEELKQVKSDIKTEEGRISVQVSNNDRIKKNIENIEFKKTIWDKDKLLNINRLQDKIDNLKNIDIDKELEDHKLITEIKKIEEEFSIINNAIETIKNIISNYETKLIKKNSQLSEAMDHKCPECNQQIHDDIFKNITLSIKKEIDEINCEIKQQKEDMILLEDEFLILADKLTELGAPPKLFYKNLHEVYDHKNILQKLEYEYDAELSKENPYELQINNLIESSMVDIDYSIINDLQSSKDHMEFLIKLLTSNESFIRKKIIEQNIKLLNNKLTLYLDRMMLPHIITFNSDLSVTIIKNGNEYDFGQLSKGEKNRIMLSVSWAFRDTWESLNGSINIWIFDEVVDTGMDTQGIMSAVDILNCFVNEMKKDVFLISHKTDLIANIENVIYAIKENDFTTYEYTE